jgi:hypothetical protein
VVISENGRYINTVLKHNQTCSFGEYKIKIHFHMKKVTLILVFLGRFLEGWEDKRFSTDRSMRV